jgi:hypothetical protein
MALRVGNLKDFGSGRVRTRVTNKPEKENKGHSVCGQKIVEAKTAWTKYKIWRRRVEASEDMFYMHQQGKVRVEYSAYQYEGSDWISLKEANSSR